MALSMPNADQVYYELEKAIQQDKRPCDMFREFLNNGTMPANFMRNAVFSNKRALALLTSPAGRAWLHKWIDDFLNYLQVISQS